MLEILASSFLCLLSQLRFLRSLGHCAVLTTVLTIQPFVFCINRNWERWNRALLRYKGNNSTIQLNIFGTYRVMQLMILCRVIAPPLPGSYPISGTSHFHCRTHCLYCRSLLLPVSIHLKNQKNEKQELEPVSENRLVEGHDVTINNELD